MKRGHNFPGLWINFESGEAGGKTTQQNLLKEYLSNHGYLVEAGREPGTTIVGESLRKILQDPNMPKLNPRTEMLLFVSAGVEFYEQQVKPVLEEGKIFMSDRWRWSTKAYQGYGLGIDLNLIDSLIDFSCEGAYPDINFLLELNPELGLSRISGNEFVGNQKDKIESRKLDFHERAHQGYLEIASQNSNSFRVIPYLDGKPNEMHYQISEEVEKFIKHYNLEKVLARK